MLTTAGNRTLTMEGGARLVGCRRKGQLAAHLCVASRAA
jgi:hypothetical protein